MPVLDLAQRQYGGNPSTVDSVDQFEHFRLAPTFGYGRCGGNP